jgi:hypothetical protein
MKFAWASNSQNSFNSAIFAGVKVDIFLHL